MTSIVQKSDKQSVLEARAEIARLKDEYMAALQKLVSLNDTGSVIGASAFSECQKAGNKYFNYVETFVGDSGLLGAHDNGTWVIGFAEDCYTILDSLVPHMEFLRSHMGQAGVLASAVEPSATAYANMQRMVSKYLLKEKVASLRKKLSDNNLPVSGFDMPFPDDKNQKLPKWQIYIAAGGVLF